MSLTTIDYTTNADLFRDVDPIGLLRDVSARSYQLQLRKRLREEFPNANVFLKWNPNRTGPSEVFTMPEKPKAEAAVLAIAAELEADKEAWITYDESVRGSFI